MGNDGIVIKPKQKEGDTKEMLIQTKKVA